MTDVALHKAAGACAFTAAADRLLRCWPAVRLTDGRILTTHDASKPELDWHVVRLDQTSFVLRVSFTNTVAVPVGVEQLR